MSTTTLPDFSQAYRDLRIRVRDLVTEASPEQLQTTATATPAWRVHDVLAHMVGLTDDVLAGRLDGVTTDAWTEAQVAPRRDVPTAALLEEWAANGDRIDPLIPGFGPAAGQMIADAATHEHDIRHALGRPGAHDSSAVHIGSHWMADVTATLHRDAGYGTLRIETDLWTETFGADTPAATLRVSAYELLRAATGRRSAAQIAGYSWNGTPRPEPLVMPIFVPRSEDFEG